ncbi:MAG: hypothetical protein GWN00_15075, partial [Aliifodinibius sp.]|nr:hypothetical protein [candidate division Zixibacteria bacterium]NIS46261.1 hypothetical protein [candidate division Zixibacteria bacterium]NIT57495.1 hypothetical protein [Fodinibius sp.]NIY26077.1 hypothetical protein [Fodinibius sp.]
SYDGYNVFYHWSNPPAKSTIGVYVTGEDFNGNIIATIYTSTPEDAPPARPYLVKLENYSEGTNQGIKLTWSANQEPDTAGYEVFRQTNGGTINKISGSSLVTDTTWVDWGEVMTDSSLTNYTYYVKAVDNTNQRSNLSNGRSTDVEHVRQMADKLAASQPETPIS